MCFTIIYSRVCHTVLSIHITCGRRCLLLRNTYIICENNEHEFSWDELLFKFFIFNNWLFMSFRGFQTKREVHYYDNNIWLTWIMNWIRKWRRRKHKIDVWLTEWFCLHLHVMYVRVSIWPQIIKRTTKCPSMNLLSLKCN